MLSFPVPLKIFQPFGQSVYSSFHLLGGEAHGRIADQGSEGVAKNRGIDRASLQELIQQPQNAVRFHSTGFSPDRSAPNCR